MNGFWDMRNALMASGAVACVAIAQPAVAQVRNFDVPAQDAAGAVAALARQADAQILISGRNARGKRTSAVKGSMTVEQALDQLLRGSGLVAMRTSARGWSVVPQRASGKPSVAVEATPSLGGDDDSGSEEIVVTGTNIRGAQSTSPLTTITRRDIVATGIGTTSGVLETLPQNFSQGGLDAGFLPGVTEQGANGSSINLGGLGEGTTLVLLNGRRLAPGFAGSAVDISGIPISAVERVEISLGGASAVYGSDAIGGVVNFILRRDFEGAETNLRAGAASGDVEEYRASQLFGHKWQGGSAVLSGEYYSRDQLLSSEREFSKSSLLGSLLPREKTASVFFSGQQELHPSTRVFLDSLYSRRETERVRAARGTAVNEQTAITTGLTSDISSGWTAEASVGFSQNKLNAVTYQIGAPDDVQNTIRSASEMLSADVKADGPLFPMFGSEVRVAVGAGIRREDYNATTTIPNFATFTQNTDRTVRSVFAEASIPLLVSQGEDAGAERLVLSLAGRVDDYSDVGTSADPKIGLLWKPVRGLALRASYGTSFRAPRLVDFDTGFNSAIGYFATDPLSGTGQSYVIDLAGIDPSSLKPERAKSFTIGAEFRDPDRVGGFRASAYYYRHSYKDQIANPPLADVVLQNPDAFGALVIRNPSLAQIGEFIAQSQLGQGFYPYDENFNPIANFDPSTVAVLIDTRRRNLSAVRTSGINFEAGYAAQLPIGQIDLTVSGTHILTRKQKLTSDSTPFETVDTTFNPPDWRIRGGATWSHQGWSSSLFVNHTDSYSDNRSAPADGVRSHTTVDARIAYDFGAAGHGGALDGLVLSVSAQNLFNASPPRLRALAPYDVGYDSTNADPLKRLVSIELTKRW
jgi:outer membrane receptor protein involved in Fe transport